MDDSELFDSGRQGRPSEKLIANSLQEGEDLPVIALLQASHLAHFPVRKDLPSLFSNNGALWCSQCMNNFANKSALKAHKQVHFSKKTFKCEECGKVFGRKGSFNYHLKTHTDIKPFECPECEKKFKMKGHLTEHLRSHYDERPFQCHLCSYRSMRSTTLKNHIKTHFGDKPYTCNICYKRFTESSNLNTHMRVHSKERPYVCPLQNCQKAFKNKSHLKEHLNSKKHRSDQQINTNN